MSPYRSRPLVLLLMAAGLASAGLVAAAEIGASPPPPSVTAPPQPAGLAIQRLPETAASPPGVVVPMNYDAGIAPGQSLEARVAELEAKLKKSADAEVKKKEDDGKKPTSKFTMQLQADTYFFSQDEANKVAVGDIQDGSAFRRARVGWLGDHEVYSYRIEFDFALPGRPSFLDVWAGIKDLPHVGQLRIGHFFEPFSLERITPNRFLTFMERSSIDQAFVPARNLGIAVNRTFFDEHVQAAAGVYRTASDNFGDDVGDDGERSVTARVTCLPFYDEPTGRYYVHLGSAYSFRDADGDSVRFRAQPEQRIGAAIPNVPFFVDTGNIPADYYQLYGAEAAVVWGSFSVQSEYIYTPVQATTQPNPNFQGWYGYVSYFLTGEHRPYRKDIGAFDRVIPFEHFFRVDTNDGVQMGLGAWEVAARYSYLDLDNADVQGGVMREFTFGLNWYQTQYLHTNFNYNHVFLDSPVNGDSEANIFAMRVNFDF